MPIYASSNSGGGTFTPHPAGTFAGVCSDVYDNGYVKTLYDGLERIQHKVTLYWFCNQWRDGEDGKRVPMLVSRRFTLSLRESAALRPFLETWRGRKFKREEAERFDVEGLIGIAAYLQVSHSEKGDDVYANVDAALKLPPGMAAPTIPADFKRRHERDQERGIEPRPAPAPAPTARHAAQAQAGPPRYDNEPEPPFSDDDAGDTLPF
jgi:hypothetical protein